MSSVSEQHKICARYGAPFVQAPDELIAGVAKNVLTSVTPINGLRHPPARGTTGWYVWAGEAYSSDADFFVPLHVAHLGEWRAEVLPYLGLPPGWRFLLAEGQEDVWFDPQLLDVS